LNALRRSYNRRVTLRQDNPFYQWIRVPSHIVEQEIESERLAKLKEAGSSDDEIDEERKKGIFVEEEERLRLAEGKKYRRKLLVKEENSTEAAPQPPLTREGEDDAFNGELADVIAGDKEEEKETVKLENELEEVKKEENGNGVKAEEGEEEWWEEQRAVEWKDLSLETKVSKPHFINLYFRIGKLIRCTDLYRSTRFTMFVNGTWLILIDNSVNTCNSTENLPG